ncbi:hypothetical protein Taro_000381 [Colocasia esculenta]|uniref:Uncharacterized protein n=1 Tax=Colocasia esculenta TaxID=4460 RepID=A0A843TEX5_COLES|nr:hypothetical protein [Colocasia esculenta]
MMVGFSCLPTHISCHKTKKDGWEYEECDTQGLDSNSLVLSSVEALEETPASSNSILEMEQSIPMHIHVEQITIPSSFECYWESEEQNGISYPLGVKGLLGGMSLRKSQSVGSGLFKEGRFSYNAETDDDIEQGLSLNFEDGNFGRLVNNSGLQEGFGSDDAGTNMLNQNQESTFGINTDPLSNCSTFFIEGLKQFDDEFCQDGEHGSPDHVVALNQMSNSQTLSKSHSLPSMGIHGSSPICRFMLHRSRSFENLCTETRKTGYLDGLSRMPADQFREGAFPPHMPQTAATIGGSVHSEADLGGGCVISVANKEHEEVSDREEDLIYRRNHMFDNELNGDHAFHNLSVSLNDWREPEMNGEEAFGSCQELNGENFNMKRIEEWIRQIDIHGSGIPQEVGESSSIPRKHHQLMNGVNASKLCAKGSGGVEVAYNHISSLAPASTSVQMTNLGLLVIPSLSAFSSLRVLNLSYNAIVKITSGSLPRGLHMLNLSRNNISTIEGLRELARLRVLDLSYNRVVRIGHGLAACSSLKELYLAGNKISEVEGLHRLLKLNILDLRFNKISTAKCLGQLAANYASLQAINLEGNPAQRNVGEEQLKRYILGLLPRLVYFNKQIIKSSSSKELSDRASRSVTPRQFDRGARSSDYKRSRRVSHAVASHKVTSSSHHSRVSQSMGYSAKPSRNRDRHAHLPPAGSKANHLPRVDSKLLSGMQPINPMRRSRSEGNL